MDLLRIGAALARRWPVVLFLLALTAAAAYSVYQGREVRFETGLSAVLASAQSTDADEAETMASGQVLAAVLESDRIRDEVLAPESDVTYEVLAGLDTAGTIINVTAEGTIEEEVVRAVQAVLARLEVEVREQEESLNVPPSQVTDVQPLAIPLEGVEIPPVPTMTDAGPISFSPVTYEAEGSTLLSVPPVPRTPFPATPGTLRYVQELMATEDVRARVQPDPSIEVVLRRDPTDRDRVPIFYLDATAPSAEEAASALDRAFDEAVGQLQLLQEGSEIPPEQQTEIIQLTAPTEPREAPLDIDRAIIMVVALGLFVTVSLTILVDSILESRKGRKSSGTPETAVDVPDSEEQAEAAGSSEPAEPASPPTRPRGRKRQLVGSSAESTSNAAASVPSARRTNRQPWLIAFALQTLQPGRLNTAPGSSVRIPKTGKASD